MAKVVQDVEVSAEQQKAQENEAQAQEIYHCLKETFRPSDLSLPKAKVGPITYKVFEKGARKWLQEVYAPYAKKKKEDKANPAKAAKPLPPQSANMRGYLRVVLNMQNGVVEILWTGKKVTRKELMTMVPVEKLEQVIMKFEHFWDFSTPDEEVQATTAELYKNVNTEKKRLEDWEDETTKTKVRYEYLMVMVDGFVSVTEMLEKSAQRIFSSEKVKAISEYLRGSGIILMEDLIKTAAYTKDPIIYRKTVVEGKETIEELDSSIDGLNKAFGVRVGMPEVDVVESWQIAPQGVDSEEMEGGSGSIEQDPFMAEPPVVGSPLPPRTPGSPEEKSGRGPRRA